MKSRENLSCENKIKLVVYNEHALGYILPEIPNNVYIFNSLLRKGGSGHNFGVRVITGIDNVRLANEQDFNEYKILMNGFKNDPKYEFAKNNQIIPINVSKY